MTSRAACSLAVLALSLLAAPVRAQSPPAPPPRLAPVVVEGAVVTPERTRT